MACSYRIVNGPEPGPGTRSSARPFLDRSLLSLQIHLPVPSIRFRIQLPPEALLECSYLYLVGSPDPSRTPQLFALGSRLFSIIWRLTVFYASIC
jgi:hypothetical protein